MFDGKNAEVKSNSPSMMHKKGSGFVPLPFRILPKRVFYQPMATAIH
jgi:hypothetical protein